MFNESIVKEALNHKCLNCPYIKMSANFKSCYCGVTQGRIWFNKKIETFCPLLAVACYELSAPHIKFHNHKSVHVELEDGLIYKIEENHDIYDMDINEYRYTGLKFLPKHGCKAYSQMKSIKYSEIKRFVSDEEINELIKIK